MKMIIRGKIQNISGRKLNSLLKKSNKVVFLDVRDKEDYDEYHIPQSINIDASEVFEKIYMLEKYKYTDLVVYCYHGSRSKGVCAILSMNGFENVYNLKSIDNYKPL